MDNATLSSLQKSRCVMLRGEITEQAARDCIAQLLFLSYQDPKQPATLLVDSPGGRVSASIALIRTITDLPCPLVTHCFGLAGGTAAVIVAHGRRGLRSAIPKAHFAFAPAFFADPHHGHVEAELSQFDTALVEIIADDTNKHQDEVADLLRSKADFSAEDALSFGLIDSICRVPIKPPAA